MSEVTRILSAIEQGDPSAADRLLPRVYDKLRKLAAQRLAQEKPGQTLEATALVHEVYVRLVDGDQARHWNSRGHFFAAAESMRRILIEDARRKRRIKHGGLVRRVDLAEHDRAEEASEDYLLALDEALPRPAAEDAAARVVELRFFAGLSREQVADALHLSVYPVWQKWNYARAWLQVAIRQSPS